MIWFVLIFFLWLLYYSIDLFRFRNPLSSVEIVTLAYKRRRGRALQEFSFSLAPVRANPDEKKAMNGRGEILKCDLDFSSLPARIAGILKYKKHEWIVFAFSSKKKVNALWWNKGPDRSMVASLLDDEAFLKAIKRSAPDTVVILHNHPNPFSRKHHVNFPSGADLISARCYQNFLYKNKLNLIEFICERGFPTLYYAAFHESFFPVGTFIEEIKRDNGMSVFKNRALRKELKRKMYYERINGK